MSDVPRETHGDPRALPDREYALLCFLAVAVLVDQTGADEETAADALDELAERGEIVVSSPDGVDWYLLVRGNVLVHSTRPWLASHLADPTNN